MSDLKPLVLPADYGACGFYRMREPARVAQDLGVDVALSDDGLPVEARQLGDSIIIDDMPLDWNVLVFQRPTLAAIVSAIKFAQSKGIACVVELDDDLTAIHKDNAAYRSYDGTGTEDWRHTLEAARLADMVITTTHSLAARFAPHGRVQVIPNYVPQSSLAQFETRIAPATVGWTGTVQTHPEDLSAAGAHIGTSVSNGLKKFAVVGDATGVREQLYLSDSVSVAESGWLPREEYLGAVSKMIDIGVVPLKLDAFNQSKSWLKGLEFASQGIPFVASPTEAYKALNELGAGLLVRKDRDWQKHLKRLQTDADFYAEQSTQVRQVAGELTYEKHGHEWVEAWAQAKENRESCS